MSEYSGVVQRVNGKDWQGKTLYSITLSGQDGWFNTGTKKPPSEGTSISFEAEKNARGYMEINTKTIKYLQDQPAQTAKAPVAASNAASGGYWDRKEQRDLVKDKAYQLGASRNTAISMVELMLKADAIKLPAKQADKEAVIWEIVERYTNKLMGTEVPAVEEERTNIPSLSNVNDNWE